MKKVAIITHYYNSKNYGGMLQAYALPYFLNKNGYEAKQVCYCGNTSLKQNTRSLCVTAKEFAAKLKWYFLDRDFYYQGVQIKKRIKRFEEFQNKVVNHTEKVYSDTSLHLLDADFDCFITGSDQVFNYNCYEYGYWLEFTNKQKLSYAASMALDAIPDEWGEYTKKALRDYKTIGVREENTQYLYSKLLNREISLNLDPVFLLEKTEWDQIAADRLIDEDYVFTYFLGSNKKERELAKEYARKHNLKLVSIPFYYDGNKLMDLNYGDYNVIDAGPREFISLIKHARSVFTDSFHAIVFSAIYHKQFAVFNRNARGEMSTRIVSITRLFHAEERFIHKETMEDIAYIEEILRGNVEYMTNEILTLRERSIRYLLNNV